MTSSSIPIREGTSGRGYASPCSRRPGRNERFSRQPEMGTNVGENEGCQYCPQTRETDSPCCSKYRCCSRWSSGLQQRRNRQRRKQRQ
jgi:hypothetical protein